MSLELDIVIGEGIEVKDGEVVTCERFGNRCEGMCLFVLIHPGLDVVDTDYDLVGDVVGERRNFHVDIGRLILDDKPVGHCESIAGLKRVENVGFGK